MTIHICSWCNIWLRDDNDGSDLVSHGMCHRCKAEMEKEIETIIDVKPRTRDKVKERIL